MPARHAAAIAELAGGIHADSRLRRAPRARDGGIPIAAAGFVRCIGRQIVGAMTLRAAFLGLALVAASAAGAVAENLESIWHGTYWGETSDALIRRFGARALALPQPIDFGDSYVDVVLRDVVVGGYKLTVFFQMDKATHELKRVQVERNRHGVNPPAFHAVAEALDDEFGT